MKIRSFELSVSERGEPLLWLRDEDKDNGTREDTLLLTIHTSDAVESGRLADALRRHFEKHDMPSGSLRK